MQEQNEELRHIVDARTDAHRFEIPLEHGKAKLEIQRQRGARTADFRSTWVPEEHRQEGHASRLVEAGLAWARDLELEVEASCPFVADYLEEESKSEVN